jgi:hypothetical protein
MTALGSSSNTSPGIWLTVILGGLLVVFTLTATIASILYSRLRADFCGDDGVREVRAPQWTASYGTSLNSLSRTTRS